MTADDYTGDIGSGKKGAKPRGMRWIDALRHWNAHHKAVNTAHVWMTPRKGTPEHAEVKAIMNYHKPDVVAARNESRRVTSIEQLKKATAHMKPGVRKDDSGPRSNLDRLNDQITAIRNSAGADEVAVSTLRAAVKAFPDAKGVYEAEAAYKKREEDEAVGRRVARDKQYYPGVELLGNALWKRRIDIDDEKIFKDYKEIYRGVSLRISRDVVKGAFTKDQLAEMKPIIGIRIGYGLGSNQFLYITLDEHYGLDVEFSTHRKHISKAEIVRTLNSMGFKMMNPDKTNDLQYQKMT